MVHKVADVSSLSCIRYNGI